MVGGTAASYMIFFLPGLLLINAAIVKRTASMGNLAEEDAVSHSMPSKLFETSYKKTYEHCISCWLQDWLDAASSAEVY